MNFQVCIVLVLCACAFADQEVDKKTDKRNLFGLGYGYNGLHAPVVAAPAYHPQQYSAPHHYSPALHAPYGPSPIDHGYAHQLPVATPAYDNLGYSGLGYSAAGLGYSANGLGYSGDLGYSAGLGYSGGLGYSAAGLGYSGGLGYSDYGY